MGSSPYPVFVDVDGTGLGRQLVILPRCRAVDDLDWRKQMWIRSVDQLYSIVGNVYGAVGCILKANRIPLPREERTVPYHE